jgi:threonylcarbamoyladenosine tRNA methylthiotransferase MtaB
MGCRLNLSESEAMAYQARQAGHEDMIVINSCAVTQEAVRQTRQTIRKMKRQYPHKSIIVTGCAAQTEPETFAAMGEVALVLGNDRKTERATWDHLHEDLQRVSAFGLETSEKILVNDIMSVEETAGHLSDRKVMQALAKARQEQSIDAHTRSFVQVQNGCNHRCTFCIIPFGRGNARSVPMGQVIETIADLAQKGTREVVLTGVDLTSYGPDLPGKPQLGTLVKAILHHVPELPRLRISSIDSIEADKTLLDCLASEARLMPHLHLSLQAGDTMILKRMKRRHSREEAIALCHQFRALRPDCVFGADLIAGFPTETEEMFNNTLRLVDECDLTFLHVFPFSPRAGTPAAKMPQLDRALIKERAARLREKGQEVMQRFLSAYQGRTHQILCESSGKGHTEHFVPVNLPEVARPGALIAARSCGVDRNGHLRLDSASLRPL